MSNTKNKSNFEDLFNNSDINLANFEKIGASFLSLGYFTYIYASNLDIAEILNESSPYVTPEELFLFGQQLILTGYLLLYLVSVKRVDTNVSKNSVSYDDIYLSPYIKITQSYLISLFANLLRYDAFLELLNLSETEF